MLIFELLNFRLLFVGECVPQQNIAFTLLKQMLQTFAGAEITGNCVTPGVRVNVDSKR